MTTKSKRGLKSEKIRLERMEKGLPLSRAYVAEIKRIRKTSGYEEASQAQSDAREDLKAHVEAIMTANPTGMEGVVIQAQALAAWQAIGLFEGMDPKAMKWPTRLAETILEQSAKA